MRTGRRNGFNFLITLALITHKDIRKYIWKDNCSDISIVLILKEKEEGVKLYYDVQESCWRFTRNSNCSNE